MLFDNTICLFIWIAVRGQPLVADTVVTTRNATAHSVTGTFASNRSRSTRDAQDAVLAGAAANNKKPRTLYDAEKTPRLKDTSKHMDEMNAYTGEMMKAMTASISTLSNIGSQVSRQPTLSPASKRFQKTKQLQEDFARESALAAGFASAAHIGTDHKLFLDCVKRMNVISDELNALMAITGGGSNILPDLNSEGR